MKEKVKFFIVLMLALNLLGSNALRAEADIKSTRNKTNCIEENNRFAIDLYSKLAKSEKEKGKNVFFSPFSISNALAMTFAGARGETEKQMAKVLHFTLPQKEFHHIFSSIIKDINGIGKKPYILKAANALWGQANYNFLKPFTTLIKKYYNGGFYTVDFVKQTEPARIRINQWVESKTEDKIKDLIAKGDINFRTRLVLTNAIYFKGDWAQPFNEKNTKPATFYPEPDKTVQVPMMNLTKQFAYMEQKNEFQAMELPYAGDDLSMVIFLPRKTYGFSRFSQDFSPKRLRECLSGMRPSRVQVFLPKFKTKAKYYLKDILSAMGMSVAFSNNADFSGMTGKRELKISKVIHQAFVDVNEKGTEAAAATAVVMARKSMPRPPVVFRADRPFAFLILHKPTGSILFMGKITNPLQ